MPTVVSSEGLCVCLSLLHLPSSFPSCSRRAAASRWLSTLGVLSSRGGSSNPGRTKRLRRLRWILPGSLHRSAEGTASALRPSCARARGARLREPGPRGGGAGSRRDPAPPLRAPEVAPVLLRLRLGFIPSRPGSGGGAGRWVPPLRVLPPAGTSSEAEDRSWLGAWRGARGAGRGRRRSQSEQRPAPTPRCAAAGRLPPPALRGPGRGGRAGGTGVRTLGRAGVPRVRGAHPLWPPASVCPVQNRVVVGCWEVKGGMPAREGEVASLKTPLSRAAKGRCAPRPLTAFFGRGPSGLPGH